MYSKFQLALKCLSYYVSASNSRGHGIHSPFVFELITHVMNDKTRYTAYEKVERLRERLVADKSMLEVQDFGAGSSLTRSNRRTVSSIAKNAAKPAKFGQLLYRMVQYYKPKNILELGTSLGITSSYLAMANPDTDITTLEGADSVASLALQNFDRLGINNIQLHRGNFDESLPAVLKDIKALDFCFIDGNHRQEPTERYFRQILPHVKNDTILVFDDIHWSRDMEQAWDTISSHTSVRCTIDLFFIGIVLFRQEFKEKQHFAIRY